VADSLYPQIADDLRGKVESGTLARGTKLPTETELMAQYGASRNTIRDAIKVLVNLRLVETRARQGTYAIDPPTHIVSTLTGSPERGETSVYKDEVQRTGRKYTQAAPKVEMQAASAVVADGLGVEVGTYVVTRHYQRFIDGTPWSLQTTFYPMSLVTKGATRLMEPPDIVEGAVAYIFEATGIKQASYQDTIAVRAADETEVSFFQLPPDGRVSVFEIYRIAFAESGEPIRITITVYPADRNKFVVTVGNTPDPLPVNDTVTLPPTPPVDNEEG
jgi:GntR family transcriptional regulator